MADSFVAHANILGASFFHEKSRNQPNLKGLSRETDFAGCNWRDLGRSEFRGMFLNFHRLL
jgi:hypothetical protein